MGITVTVISGRQFAVVNNEQFNYVINYVINYITNYITLIIVIISHTIDDDNHNNNNTDPIIIDYVSAAIDVSIDVIVSCTVW